ncbi:hypothetical protein HYU09_02760 [Candidatus Woesearchaeota archaeon]|nr:hypothetical protein [Candidatus Woesearchaeota archaeon]
MAADVLTMLLLPALLFVGIVTSYEDIKIGKIRNKWIILALVYSLAAVLLTIVLLYMQNEPISSFYIKQYFTNMAFALFVGLLIWLSNLWSAGDAKLFLAYAALIPLSFYQFGYINYFPSFIVMINTFTPFLIFYLYRILFKTSTKLKLNIVKNAMKPKFLFESLIFIFAFIWLGRLIALYFIESIPVLNNMFVILLFMLFAFYILKNALKANLRNLSITLSILAIISSPEIIFTSQFLKTYALVSLLFLFIRYFILNLSFELFSYPIYIENLKPGMVIAENFSKEKSTYKKKKIAPLGFMSLLMERSEGKLLLSSLSEGLTKKDIGKIKKLHSKGFIKDHSIRIFQTIPFAPFIFIGVLLTLLSKGNIFFAFF